MAIKTTLEQIEEVQAAISAIETSGQDVTMSDGKRWTMANLSTLYAREEKLLARHRRENGGGLTINIGGPRRD
ncbi:hypothetical protein Dvar_36280 [Desulfosarcina variabilis str. Montpellier]|uniref:hypothetical protein n=1 Tax=Desulfosarcina variabilis TaxID=2300 RepID=UPI003AFB4CE4